MKHLNPMTSVSAQ